MTDKDLDLLFKSIENFDEFVEKVCQLQNMKLKNEVKIIFSESAVEICLSAKKVYVTYSTFEEIINELLCEESSRVQQEKGKRRKIAAEQHRDEIIDLGENQYKVSSEYIEHMLSSSEIASAQEGYIKKLEDLTKILDRNGVLMINNKKIFTRPALMVYLKSRGFLNVDKDLKQTNVTI